MKIGIFLSILAAFLYAISSPLSKILLSYIKPTLMAGFLYLGAGVAMIIIALFRKVIKNTAQERKLSKKRFTIYHFNDNFRYFSTNLFTIWSKYD